MITDFDDAIVVDVNEAAERLFGLGRAQMVGRAAGEFYVNPDALRGAHAALAVQGVIANLHMVLRNSDGGAPIHAMASANQIAVDGRRYAINQFVDISGELAARAEQKRREHLLLSIVRGVAGETGAGFAMRFADKPFTPFQRMHRQDEFEGTGIGLVIVQWVIARHGGRIWVKAAPGQGATFRVTLSAGA